MHAEERVAEDMWMQAESYRQCSRLQRARARRALADGEPTDSAAINRAALEWGSYSVAIIFLCFAVVTAVATQQAVSGQIRSVGLYLAAMMELALAARFAAHYVVFRRKANRNTT